MADRGEYRAIRRVLLDGPDFQKLPSGARFVFLALKLNIGPAGIETHYRAALAAQVAEQTGICAAEVERAFDALQGAGWIEWERNVVWIKGQLTHDPHINASDEKHRKSIKKHIAGLPRIGIVDRFKEAHAEWFPEGPTQGPSKGLPSPPEAPNTENRVPSTDNRRPSTEEREPKSEEEAVREPAPEPDPTDGGDDSDRSALVEEMKADARGALRERPKERRAADGALLRQLFTGDDRTAWQDHRGDQVGWSDRPRLFRLALGHWLGGARDKPRAAVILAIQQQYDPFERTRSSDPIPDTEHAEVRAKDTELPGRERQHDGGTTAGLRLVGGGDAPREPADDIDRGVREWIEANPAAWEAAVREIAGDYPLLAKLDPNARRPALERLARARVRETIEREAAA